MVRQWLNKNQLDLFDPCATGLSWICYFKALQLGKVSQVAPIDKLSVALAIILAVVFLKESLNIKQAIGALMIIGGSIVLIFA